MLNVKSTSLDWALKHVMRFSDTDVLPMPFEYQAIQHSWDDVRNHLSKADLHSWGVRAHRTLLAPKGRFAFRVITQLDPLDSLLYAALTREISSDLEKARILKAREIVFSYRVSIDADGQLFDPHVGYEDFMDKTRQFLENKTITHVAIADIADFYHRIYHHRLENALSAATRMGNHVSAIMRLLSGWNGTETFGIPVGNAPSRVLAETLIADVDAALLAMDHNFIRYNDDYRFFSNGLESACRSLAFLAETLYRNHGLTLQPQKTLVLTAKEFRDRFLHTPEEREIDSLQHKFDEIMDKLELSHPYAEIEYEDLDDEQKGLVDSLNLSELFQEEITNQEIDFAIVRFVLRRMGQLGDDALVDDVFKHLHQLYPAFPDIIRYLGALRDLPSTRYHEIGRRVLKLLDRSLVSELEYHRMWALDLFTHDIQWDNQDHFAKMLADANDQFSRRKLILALGRAHQRHWFQSHWRHLADEPPWPRRALLAGANCMPSDARKHWYRSIDSQLDELEKAVVAWAKANPF